MQVMQGSWFEPLQHLRGRLCGILSNPPYVPAPDLPTLQASLLPLSSFWGNSNRQLEQAEVRHEPELALDGGSGTGLDCLTDIVRGAAEVLQPCGFLGLESNGASVPESSMHRIWSFTFYIFLD